MKKSSGTRQTRGQIKALTVRQFQQHLANGLQDLPLPPDIIDPLLKFLEVFPEPVLLSPSDLPEQRSVALTYPYRQTEPLSPRARILDFLGEVPTEDEFWGGLGMAEQIEQESHGLYSAAQIADEYLSGRDGSFEKHYNTLPPPEWRESAANVLLVLDTLRAGATLATKKGRPEQIPEGEKAARKRAKDTEAQRRLSGRDYRVVWQAAYQKGARALEAKGKATAQNLRTLADRIRAAATPTRKAPVKRQALADFARWAEEDINQRTLRNNSR